MLQRLRLRLRSMLRRPALERELDAELQSYIEEMADRGVERGLAPAAARRAALREAGSLVRVKEGCRDSWRTNLFDDCVRDLRFGLRSLRRSQGFSAVVLTTLALGIGASTAMFGQVNAVFLTPLPVERPAELRLLDWTTADAAAPRRYNLANRLSYAAFRAVREHARGFADVACWSGAFVNLDTRGRLEAQVVSGNYFPLLGAPALHGRTMTPADEGAGARVAVISHRLWQGTFGGSPSAIGETVRINGEPVEIVGVMPRPFFGLNPARVADIYLPLSMYSSARFDASAPRRLDNDRDWSACEIVARLKPGVSDETARLEAEILVARAPFASDRGSGPRLPAGVARGPADGARWLRMVPASRGTDDLRVQTSRSLAVLMTATLLLLLVACANVAGLLLARAPVRTEEIGTRLALGASRSRVVRQLVIESLVLAAGAGLLGILLAYEANLLLPGLLGSFVSNGADVGRVQPGIDLRVLGFAVAASVLTGLAFGVAPARAATRIDLLHIVKRLPIGASTSRGHTRALVTAQIALALLLLIGAGLLMRTVANLRAAGAADAAQLTLHFGASPGQSGYRGAQLRQWFEEVVTALQAAPGVEAASGLGASNVCLVDTAREAREGLVPTNAIAPGRFRAAGTPLVAGRDFTWEDREGRPLVAIANQAFAREYFGAAAVGEIVRFCRNHPARTIVGVAADDSSDPRNPQDPTLYIPFMQPPPPLTGNIINFTVRARGNPAALAPIVREAVARLDANVPIFDVETGTERRERSITRERLLTGFAVVYGAVALFLASLGVYGVLAYSVSRRTGELGIRMALGADRTSVVRMVVSESFAPVALGLALGTGGALILTRWIESILFGVSPMDPVTIAVAAAPLMATAAAAALIPAWRAARIDPLQALRVH